MSAEDAPAKEPGGSGANLSVVITDLPDGTTLEQVSRFCKKAGALATHPQTGEDLILLNPRTHKATVTYNYPEGANYAIELLSEEQFCHGHRVKVERAPKEPFNFAAWKPALRQQRKFHSYAGDHEEELKPAEQKRLKIMVLRKVFTPHELVENPELYGQIIKDWTATCEKFGKVTLVKPIEANPEGVVLVRFETPQAAALAIGELDLAEYGGRKVTTEPWDGTDLSVREAPETEEERLARFHTFLDD